MPLRFGIEPGNCVKSDAIVAIIEGIAIMTTTVKVHVNGRYRATVQQKCDGEPYGDPVQINPQEERSFTAFHGKANTFDITEEYLGDKADA